MPDTNELKTLQERILAGDVAAVPAFRKKLLRGSCRPGELGA